MKKRYYIIIYNLFFFIPLVAFSQSPQKEITDRKQLWLGYFNQTRFTKHLGLWVDLHYRMTDNFVDESFQQLNRAGFTYYITDDLRFTAGHAYVHHFAEHGLKTARHEHRPWQQIWWRQNYPGFQTLQWLRFEQRFNQRVVDDVLQDGYRFNYRLRYNFSLFVPLTAKEMKAKGPFLAFMDEVFINMGKEIKYNYFDQNRFFAGIGYTFNPHLNVQLGYMNLFQQQASGNKFFNNHAIRCFVFHSLDLRKKAH